MRMKEAIKLNKESGSHFFDKDTMEFWGSRLESELYNGEYFITSELDYHGTRRYYNIRKFNEDFSSVTTVGPFNRIKSLEEARKELSERLEGDDNE